MYNNRLIWPIYFYVGPEKSYMTGVACTVLASTVSRVHGLYFEASSVAGICKFVQPGIQ